MSAYGCAGNASTQQPIVSTAASTGLGKVEFPNSGAEEAQADFIRGVLYLHSFEYAPARAAFQAAQEIDPDFAMAYWGEAMTHHASLWRRQDEEAGRAVLERLGATAAERAAKAPTEREKHYIRAAETLFGMTEKTRNLGKLERDVAYRDEMKRLHETYPDDLEARAFYGLSILGVGSANRDYATYMKAAAILTPVWDANHQHPGAAHYLIHAYDDPVHAILGLPMARAYGDIAVGAAHAQHMTSHIYVALGLWDDMTVANVTALSVESAKTEAEGSRSREAWHHRYWLHYGRLQQGRLDEARGILREAREHVANDPLPREPAYYGAMYARQVIDTELWDEAERWLAPNGVEIPTPHYDFARAYAAVKQGRTDEARRLLAEIEPGGDQANPEIILEQKEVDILKVEVEALIELAEGDEEDAVRLASRAADMQASMPFRYGPPRISKPTGELLADVYFEIGEYALAAEAYEDQLSRSQLRTSSLLGLARARARLGEKSAAREAYAALAEIWDEADAAHFALAEVGRTQAAIASEGERVDEDVHGVLVEGTGVYSRPIGAASPRAQAFFDQGLRLVWGYYFPDAAASFQEAARLDPDNPMIDWGLALAISPNPNSRYLGFADDPQGLGKAAIQRAKARVGRASEKDRAFIDALHVRYDDDAIPNREARYGAYLEKAHALAKRYPDDPDAVALYADAAMTSTPWLYWDEHGEPVSEDIANALRLLEASMEERPDHPGTNHLYMHIVESSPTPERALAQADRLESLMPTAGHVVHMPSHIYVRTGQYQKAIESNQRSLAADERFLAAWGDRPFPIAITSHKLSASVHAWHAQDFIRYSASVQGNYEKALEAARTAARIAVRDGGPEHGRSQLAVAAVWQIHKMFGKWDAVLSEPVPSGEAAYRDAAIAYAKGSAYVAKGDLETAERELARVRTAADALEGVKIPGMANMPGDLLAIAMKGLEGEIAEARGDIEEAIAAFDRAVKRQDRLRYVEPPDWPHSMRLHLGRALLEAGRAEDTERVCREDLEWHQNNGWALHGLQAALAAQGKIAAAAEVQRRFEKSWHDTDTDPMPKRVPSGPSTDD